METLKKRMQDFFREGTLLIIGSGLSCSEGLPGMAALGDELNKEISSKVNETDLKIWEDISKELNNGLEAALLKVKATQKLEEEIKRITADFIRAKEESVISEVFNGNKILKLKKLLSQLKISENGLNIVTPNYDRLIEVACESEKIPVETMFYGNCILNFDKTKSEQLHRKKDGRKFINQKHIKLFKPHGCLSWYRKDGKIIGSSLSLPAERLIITPGSNKYKAGYEEPFTSHRNGANEAIENADRYIIIGYGFNDDHLETHLNNEILSGKETLILTFEISERAKKLIADKKSNIIALESEGENTKIYFKNINGKAETKVVENKKLWDVEDFVEEVF